ncbi:hypothetical protein [Candidatus Palauibacter sp.]|uniref:hypothetical protein n=1 Tax=Candidatus Palauibacter sp. TaxID=3101350 RepID=UPI003B0234BD
MGQVPVEPVSACIVLLVVTFVAVMIDKLRHLIGFLNAAHVARHERPILEDHAAREILLPAFRAQDHREDEGTAFIASCPPLEEQLAEGPLEVGQRRPVPPGAVLRDARPHAPLRPVKEVAPDAQEPLAIDLRARRDVDEFESLSAFRHSRRRRLCLVRGIAPDLGQLGQADDAVGCKEFAPESLSYCRRRQSRSTLCRLHAAEFVHGRKRLVEIVGGCRGDIGRTA